MEKGGGGGGRGRQTETERGRDGERQGGKKSERERERESERGGEREMEGTQRKGRNNHYDLIRIIPGTKHPHVGLLWTVVTTVRHRL